MQPQRKRQRVTPTASASSSFSIPLLRSHPCNVQPLGNFYLSASPSCQPAGLGVLHSVLNDSLLLHVLSFLSPSDLLLHASPCSQALYVYCREEELYRAAVLSAHGGDFRFDGSWRETWISEELRTRYEQQQDDGAALHAQQRASEWLQKLRSVSRPRIRGFYSDTLFQSFYCSAVDLRRFNNPDNIQRVALADLTPHSYLTRFAVPNLPFIITGAVQQWPAAQWTTEWLEREYGDEPFKVGAYVMSMRDYMRYCRQSTDESPLYLFDSGFGDKYPRLAAEYEVPWCFRDDLFELLAEMPAKEGYNDGCEDRETPGAHMHNRTRAQRRSKAAVEETKEECKEAEADAESGDGASTGTFGSMRPAYRWILIGPTRSGSTFHKVTPHRRTLHSLPSLPSLPLLSVECSPRPLPVLDGT